MEVFNFLGQNRHSIMVLETGYESLNDQYHPEKDAASFGSDTFHEPSENTCSHRLCVTQYRIRPKVIPYIFFNIAPGKIL
jgi:hypothetical protein